MLPTLETTTYTLHVQKTTGVHDIGRCAFVMPHPAIEEGPKVREQRKEYGSYIAERANPPIFKANPNLQPENPQDVG